MDDMKQLKKELEELKSQIGRLPQVREQEVVQATKEERKAKAARLQELRRTRPIKMEALQQKWREADQKAKDAQENLKKVLGEYRVVDGRLFAEGWALDQEIRELESFLHRTAPTILRHELERAQNRVEEARARPVERLIEPDLPGAETVFYDAEGKEHVRRPVFWGKRHSDPTPYQLRLKELAELQEEITRIEEQILAGGE